MAKLVDTPVIEPQERFPGLPHLAANAPEPVLARLWSGTELEGKLTAFIAAAEELEIELPGGPRRMKFSEIQWLKFTRPVEYRSNAEAFRKRGLHVETPVGRTPFSLAFTDGHVLAAELYGFGIGMGGLGVYLAGDEAEIAYRLFVPVAGIEGLSVGDRLGTLLLSRGELTPGALEIALEHQQTLRSQRLGSLLIETRRISRAQLEMALAQQAAQPVRPLGEVLVEMGILTPVQIQKALEQQRGNRRKPLGEVLVELELIDRATLQAVLAQKLGIPSVDLRRYAFDPSWGDLAAYPLCRQYRMVPLYRADNSVTVALDDPLAVERLNALAFALGSQVIPVLASPEDIAWALERHPERQLYEALEEAAAGKGVTPTRAELEGEDAQTLASRLAGEMSGEAMPEQQIQAGDSTLVRLVNKIIADAYHGKASDIHIEPGNGRERLRVRFRRDGALFDYLTLSARFRAAIVSRLKIMASLDISEHRRPQDGKIDCRRFGGLPLELRMACLPTLNGLEAVCLRLLAAVKPLPIDKIGLPPQDLERLRGLSEKSNGLIIVCGPTGSGKTTTLHSVLAHLNTPETKIWTAEDPVEITQPGLTQVQMHAAIGLTFATALRAFLRADPDIIMIGEVRDAETARIMVEASLTGHLVLTTLHTNSAAESVTRLVDIGVDPFNFADALLGVLAQRLTRKLCLRCRSARPASEEQIQALAAEYCRDTALREEQQIAAWRESFGAGGTLTAYKPVGCKVCNGTGFSGRLALFELLVASPAIKRLILQHATLEQIATRAQAEGMRTLKQDGIDKVLQGLTTMDQVRAASY